MKVFFIQFDIEVFPIVRGGFYYQMSETVFLTSDFVATEYQGCCDEKKPFKRGTLSYKLLTEMGTIS